MLLWRDRGAGVGRKIIGTVGLLLYSVVYAAAVVFILYKFFGLEYEFRGGYVPRLTFWKTVPNYDALEKSRGAPRPGTTSEGQHSTAALTNSYWNGFRGPRRDGHYDEMPIRADWPAEGVKPVWHQPIGGGYASFAIGGNRAFTIEQRREKEAAVAYEVESGREIWTHDWVAEFTESLGGDGPRATPAFDEGRVYVLGALGEFRCLDAATGQLHWRKNIVHENDAPELTYGMAASPLVVDDKIIVQAGGRNGKSVVAYNKSSGEKVWAALDDGGAYSSPMLVELAGHKQLLVVTKHRAVGLEPSSGVLLWEFPWVVLHGNRNIAQPVLLSSNRFFLSAGYGTGCAAIEIARSTNGFSAAEIWRNKNLKNKFTSSVFWQGHIYGLDEDILTCLEAQTGSRKWKSGRYGYGQLLLAGGQLIILTGTGEIAVVKATPDDHVELTRFPVIRGKTWNNPAIGSGWLLVRNSAEMAGLKIAVSQ